MASSTQNTVILLIHGAWQRPIHYLNLASSLQASNLDIRIPALATAGHQADVPGKSINDDVIVIREVLNELLAQNKTIVMVCHSYGGIPGTDAASGETVEERCKQGKFGGIKAVVYLAAFAIPTAGTNLLQMVGVQNATQHPPWWLPKDGLAVLKKEAPSMIYSGVGSELARISGSAAVPQSLQSFVDPCTHGASSVSARKIYIACREDMVTPFELQERMARDCGAELVRLTTGHSPFLLASETSKIAEVIIDAANGQ